MSNKRTILLFVVGLVFCLATPTYAGVCTDNTCQFVACRAPASGVPGAIWGELQPTDIGLLPSGRDNTDFNEFANPFNETEPHWMAVDIEEGWIFAGINMGLEIWNGQGDLAQDPSRVSLIGRNSFPFWVPGASEEKNPVRDLDSPPDNSDLLAVSLVDDIGLAIFDTSDKTNPQRKYGDRDKQGNQVYAGHIGGRDYAFMASRTGGLRAYDMTSAGARATVCVENTAVSNSCGVFESRLGSRNDLSYLDGAGSSDNSQHWVVASSGLFGRGFEVYDVSNPSSPVLELSALATEFVHGVGLWRTGNSYYLGTRVQVTGGTQARIYNLSCISGAGASCGSLGSAVWTQSLPSDGTEYFVTYSQAGNRDFLYYGNVNRCAVGSQNEWLFDVSNPSSPQDITPSPGLVNGQSTGYWGWYYRRNPTGFNRINPRMGKFAGQYFYRAAFTIFDIHKITTSIGLPPVANFTFAPEPILQGITVSFTDLSTNGPTGWAWTFQDATPATSTAQNPTAVFNSTGNKQICLTATSGAGSDQSCQSLSVSSTGSVTVSGPGNGEIGELLTYTASAASCSPSPSSWNWSLGANAVVSGPANQGTLQVIYDASGAKTVTATAVGGQCAGLADSTPLTINANPDLLVKDGFETGNTSRWTQEVSEGGGF